jgi:hypothetical protein
LVQIAMLTTKVITTKAIKFWVGIFSGSALLLNLSCGHKGKKGVRGVIAAILPVHDDYDNGANLMGFATWDDPSPVKSPLLIS